MGLVHKCPRKDKIIMKKFIFCGFAAILVWSLTFCYNKLGAEQTYRSQDGFTIKPLKVEPNEVADILEIKIWKFNVTIINPELKYRFLLELDQEGRAPQEIFNSSGGNILNKDKEVMIALYPLLDSMGQYDKLKILFGVNGGSVSFVVEDPAKNYSSSSPKTSPKLQSDGSFILMSYSNTGKFPDPTNSLLVFKVIVEEP
jgi:hypothetical protein